MTKSLKNADASQSIGKGLAAVALLTMGLVGCASKVPLVSSPPPVTLPGQAGYVATQPGSYSRVVPVQAQASRPGYAYPAGGNAGGSYQGAGGEQGANGRVIYFDYDQFNIRPEAQPVVDGNAQMLRANPSAQVKLQGHTDNRGGREYNLALGQKRAESTKSALKLLGVTETQVEAVSFGKENPAAMGEDEASHQANRRVEFAY